MATTAGRYRFAHLDRAADPVDGSRARADGRRLLLMDFALGETPRPAPPGDPGPAPAPPPRFSQAELEDAVRRAELEAERRTAARVEAEMQARVERRLAAAAGRLVDELAALRRAHAEAVNSQAAGEVEAALALGRMIVPWALERAPLADVEAMLVDLLAGLGGEPRLELRLANDLIEAGRRLFADAAERAGLEAALEVVADPELGPGEARLLWDQGTAERRLERIRLEAETMLRHRFAADAPARPAPALQAVAQSDNGGGAP